MILRDRFGWPVELVEGRPVLNFFRRLLVTSPQKTWAMRREGWPVSGVADNTQAGTPQQSKGG
jgi:hypothetical protein